MAERSLQLPCLCTCGASLVFGLRKKSFADQWCCLSWQLLDSIRSWASHGQRWFLPELELPGSDCERPGAKNSVVLCGDERRVTKLWQSKVSFLLSLQTHTHTHTHSLSLSHTLSLTHTHTHTHTHKLTFLERSNSTSPLSLGLKEIAKKEREKEEDKRRKRNTKTISCAKFMQTHDGRKKLFSSDRLPSRHSMENLHQSMQRLLQRTANYLCPSQFLSRMWSVPYVRWMLEKHQALTTFQHLSLLFLKTRLYTVYITSSPWAWLQELYQLTGSLPPWPQST